LDPPEYLKADCAEQPLVRTITDLFEACGHRKSPGRHFISGDGRRRQPFLHRALRASGDESRWPEDTVWSNWGRFYRAGTMMFRRPSSDLE